MDEKTKQALNVLEQLANGALANGLFKRFEDSNTVQAAIEHLKKVLQSVQVQND